MLRDPSGRHAYAAEKNQAPEEGGGDARRRAGVATSAALPAPQFLIPPTRQILDDAAALRVGQGVGLFLEALDFAHQYGVSVAVEVKAQWTAHAMPAM